MKIALLIIVIGLLSSCSSTYPQLSQNAYHDPIGRVTGNILNHQSLDTTNYTINALNMNGIPEAKEVTKVNGKLVIK